MEEETKVISERKVILFKASNDFKKFVNLKEDG